MISLTHPVTGHEIKVDEESAEFWGAAGYRAAEPPKATKKATAKRSTSSKSS